MFDPIEDIIEEAKLGRPFIITDDEDRENEGDIIIPAQYITTEVINLMIMFARGLICVAIDQKIANKFDLKLHPRRNIDEFETAFTYSIDSRQGVSTGMSAIDKVHTIQKLVNENSTIADFKVPGHIFPVVARERGVLERRGHTEAAVDIAKLAKLKPAMVICEIINDDGTMARRNDLIKFSKKHGMKISSVEKLVQYIK
ncbi:3,4-dihydroxy-2-butanone-4-phosphate synthase [Candidatus Bandiella numerosa]|jgi:3,4-dihydroxy 2-butanone 4-phosphate synthase / GTP cyclohydrolase II|uniref:3,4-dihydroxy-2-butanone-4-phosphate synthase n=1 Tax=Candidatus Bandiella numerosa TaxID=2570586 RepID=UPI00249F071F|nr:3,4-dihydroxy-2-butanone-4-phosphate synthase [Candidatus Bandiella numerosa]WHA04357.1 3,4-dihydroxy-2-butanone-4-phosphate synthase [Candidatus Bandiella numerosa]